MTSKKASPFRLLLLGYGHVARALLPLLAARGAWLARELGVRPLISGVGSRSQGFFIFPAGLDVGSLVQESGPLMSLQPPGPRVETAEAFLYAGKSVGADVLIELTTLNPLDGQPALDHIRMALQAGMHVITANKGPIAYGLAELQKLAHAHDAQFRFESAVLDGLPLMNLSEYTLPAVDIQAFRALLNTTSSLVLSMIEEGQSLDEALARAQQLGIAEADPWHDLDGWDAVMKTTILANTLLEGHLLPHMVERAGIRDLSPDEVRAAARSGTPIRLVSQARRDRDDVIASVHPQRIQPDDILRVGTGMTGIISLETGAMGPITLVEHEPTVQQTAYGVFSDLVNIVRRRQGS